MRFVPWIFLDFMRCFIIFFPQQLERYECYNWWEIKLNPTILSSLVFLLASVFWAGWHLKCTLHIFLCLQFAQCPMMAWIDMGELGRTGSIDIIAEPLSCPCFSLKLLLTSLAGDIGVKTNSEQFCAPPSAEMDVSKCCVAKSPNIPHWCKWKSHLLFIMYLCIYYVFIRISCPTLSPTAVSNRRPRGLSNHSKLTRQVNTDTAFWVT